MAIDTNCFGPISHSGLFASANSQIIAPDAHRDDLVPSPEPTARKGAFKTSVGGQRVIRIRTVAEGLLLAEEWGLHISQIKPWENKARAIPEVPEHRRAPIDREDREIKEGVVALMGVKPSGRSRVPRSAVAPTLPPMPFDDTADPSSPVHVGVISPVMWRAADDMGLHLPAAGTEIEVSKKISQQITEQIAGANGDDPRHGDKVAALAQLLGSTIAKTHGKTWKGFAAHQQSGDAQATPVKLQGA